MAESQRMSMYFIVATNLGSILYFHTKATLSIPCNAGGIFLVQIKVCVTLMYITMNIWTNRSDWIGTGSFSTGQFKSIMWIVDWTYCDRQVSVPILVLVSVSCSWTE